jgi:hypothetical protein
LKYIPGYRLLSDALRRHYDQYSSSPFLKFAEPGHFYSPLPDLGFVDACKDALFDRRMTAIQGIDTNADSQLALVDQLSEYYPKWPFEACTQGFSAVQRQIQDFVL